MEEATDIKTVWFTNMLLLGLDPHVLERKLRIPFNKDMFILPNKKGFEVIMYFLFEKLNPLQTKEEFRYCYPASDKKQEAQFRKVCNDWLTRLSKEEPDANLPRIVASIFLSPGGDKFYELLFAFSTYILTKHISTQYGFKSRDTLTRPTLSSQTLELGVVLQSAIKSSAVRHRRRFLEKCESVVDVQQNWKEHTSREVKKYRSLSKGIKDTERKVKSEVEVTAEKGASRGSPFHNRRRSGFQDQNFDLQGVKRANRVQKVRDLWKVVDSFYEKRAEERQIVSSVIEGTMDKYKIDSNRLDVKIPDLLLRECEKEIHRRSVGNIYQGGKLNLHSLLQLWNLSLHLYIEKLHQVGITTFEDASPIITTQLHTHQAHLSNAQTLRNKLSKEILPVLKQSVDILKKRSDAYILNAKLPGSIRSTSLGLNLLPTTPPVTFTPADQDHSSLPDCQHIVPKTESVLVSTPEAASQLIDSITNKVRGKQLTGLAHGLPVYTWKQQQSKMHKDNVEVERVGNKQRTRIRSAPANTMTSTVRSSLVHSTLDNAPDDTKTAKVTSEIADLSNVKNVKITSSGTQLVEIDREHVVGAKHTMTEQIVRQKSVLAKDNDVFKMPISVAKKSTANRDQFAPKIEKHYHQRVSFVHKPQAHDILADQIVESILSEENRDQELTDNIIIGKEAFVSKDKLTRTPETQPRVPAYPADYNSLLNESLTHMPSRLSSTRIEAVAIDREDAQDLATRLFAEDTDGEDEIVTAGPDISPTPPSTVNLSYNNSASKASLSGQNLPRDVFDKENTNPNSSLRRLDGDGGPAFKMSDNSEDANNSSNGHVLNLNKLEAISGKTNISRQLLSDVDEINSSSGHHLLATTEALYNELNQSQTPELPSKRGRSIICISRDDMIVTPTHQSPESTSLSPNRSPKIDELHKSLDHFEELVHSIQEAAHNISTFSQESASERVEKESLKHSVGKMKASASLHNSINDEPFPGNINMEDELANLSVRVIEVQNGTFTEFMELSSRKKKVVSLGNNNSANDRGHYFSQTIQNDTGVKKMQTLGHNGLNEIPIDREALGSLDRETESIIARYKRLKLASSTENDNSSNNTEEIKSENSKQSPVGTSPLNEKYLQETPNKIKVRMSKKISLAFESEPDLQGERESIAQISIADDEVFKKPKTPPRSHRPASGDSDKLINLSPFSTPTRRNLYEDPTCGSPMFGLHSVPLSPTTDALHKERLTPRTRKRRSMFESILDEDESVLLPSSPPTGNLLDL